MEAPPFMAGGRPEGEITSHLNVVPSLRDSDSLARFPSTYVLG
jgi:hypothetical protein